MAGSGLGVVHLPDGTISEPNIHVNHLFQKNIRYHFYATAIVKFPLVGYHEVAPEKRKGIQLPDKGNQTMNGTMAPPRIRLAVDTTDAVRRAVKMRAAKIGSDPSTVVNEILVGKQPSLAPEVAEILKAMGETATEDDSMRKPGRRGRPRKSDD
jgi:hypothetical protein